MTNTERSPQTLPQSQKPSRISSVGGQAQHADLTDDALNVAGEVEREKYTGKEI